MPHASRPAAKKTKLGGRKTPPLLIFRTHQVLVEILADVRRELEGANENEEQAQEHGEALQNNRVGGGHLG